MLISLKIGDKQKIKAMIKTLGAEKQWINRGIDWWFLPILEMKYWQFLLLEKTSKTREHSVFLGCFFQIGKLPKSEILPLL